MMIFPNNNYPKKMKDIPIISIFFLIPSFFSPGTPRSQRAEDIDHSDENCSRNLLLSRRFKGRRFRGIKEGVRRSEGEEIHQKKMRKVCGM
jgi:hypothetical protein